MNLFQTLGFLLGVGLSLGDGWSAILVNDGTTTNTLARLTNENGRGEADSSLVVNSGELVANQFGSSDLTLIPLRSVWYALNVFPTSGVYTVTADFRPADVTFERRGGVMGWLDIGSTNRKGISFEVQPASQGGQEASFQVSVVDFDAVDANTN